jgi:hypothetical protein
LACCTIARLISASSGFRHVRPRSAVISPPSGIVDLGEFKEPLWFIQIRILPFGLSKLAGAYEYQRGKPKSGSNQMAVKEFAGTPRDK